jgi:hypothetical protein
MMADNIPVRIAKAVAAEINSAVAAETLSQQFTAVFSFGSEITEFQKLNDDTLTVDVAPTSDQQVSLYAAGSYRHAVSVAVGIRRRVAPTDRNEAGAVDSDAITSYSNLLYEMFAMFAAGRELTDEPNVTWDPSRDPVVKLYDSDMLKDGLYFGWIHLPFVLKEVAT